MNDISQLELDVNTIMSELDKNNDGVITQDEFKSSFELLLNKMELDNSKIDQSMSRTEDNAGNDSKNENQNNVESVSDNNRSIKNDNFKNSKFKYESSNISSIQKNNNIVGVDLANKENNDSMIIDQKILNADRDSKDHESKDIT